MLLLVHTLVGKCVYLELGRFAPSPHFIPTSKQVPTPIICVDKSDDTRKVCCSRCCLVMLCDFAGSRDSRLY